jgi:phospholipid-translocating ATPase
MCAAAGTIVFVANDDEANWGVLFFRHVLLLSSIIPISLRVNLDFSKLIFSIKINRDKGIPGAIARNSTIPEELGRV